jgi:hypothetical protein
VTAYDKLPRKIWVGTYEFRIFVVPANDPVLVEDPDEIAEGLTCTDTRRIWFADGLEPRRLFELVWHETRHAVNWAYDVEDKLAAGGDAEILEEELTELDGRAWTALWLDNPKLVRWFSGVATQIRKEREKASA